MSAPPASQLEPGRTCPRLNPDSWRNANQTADWLKSSVRTHFISDMADPDIYSYDLPPPENGGSRHPKDSRRVYFNIMRGCGRPEDNIGLPGDIYWDLTSFDRYVLWTRNLEKWVVWNWSDTKPTKTQFELVQHPFVKGRYLWGTPSQKLGWRASSWLRKYCDISPFDYQDPHMLLKDILNEEKSAPEGPGQVSALNQVRMNAEENRRSTLLETASKNGRVYHPPPDGQSRPQADQGPPFKCKKRSENHRRSSSERDPSWRPTATSAKRQKISDVHVQTAIPRIKPLSTPGSASVSRSPGATSSSTAQVPRQMVNGDRNSNQSLRASESLLAAQTSSTPPSPSHQTAPEPEFAAADLNLDDFIDAAYSRAVKAFQEIMQSEKKELKKVVLAHSEQNERRRIEAEEDAKNARAEAMTAKERLGQIHGLSADKI